MRYGNSPCNSAVIVTEDFSDGAVGVYEIEGVGQIGSESCRFFIPETDLFECDRRCLFGFQVFAGHVQFRNDAVVIAPFAPGTLAEARLAGRSKQDVRSTATGIDGHAERIELLNGAS